MSHSEDRFAVQMDTQFSVVDIVERTVMLLLKKAYSQAFLLWRNFSRVDLSEVDATHVGKTGRRTLGI